MEILMYIIIATLYVLWCCAYTLDFIDFFMTNKNKRK